MIKFIKCFFVLALFAGAAVFGPEAQAKSVTPSATSSQMKDVTDPPIVNQPVPGTVNALWNVVPPGNLSTVYLMDLTNSTWQMKVVAGNNTSFNGVISGHNYVLSVYHGQNVKSTAFVGH